MTETTHNAHAGRTLPPGRYLYAIVSAAECTAEVVASLPAGIVGLPVAPIEADGLLALASPAPADRAIRPKREHLAAHQGVLATLGKRVSVLPMSFGIVADDERCVERLLRAHGPTLSEQLDRVRGRVEMGLRLSWAVDDVFALIMQRHPEIAQAKADAARAGGDRDTLIAIGQMVERAIEGERETLTAALEEAMSNVCVEIARNTPRSDAEIANLACLIERAEVDAFEAALHAAAASYTDEFGFDYSGPWAPHNFVRLDIDFGADLPEDDDHASHPDQAEVVTRTSMHRTNTAA